MDLFKRIVLSFFIALLISCVSYSPKPLRGAEFKKQLIIVDQNVLIQEAIQPRHPSIPTIKLDFSKPLTAEELRVIAVLVNPTLKALRAKEGVARAQVFDAGLLPNPQFNGSYDQPLHQ